MNSIKIYFLCFKKLWLKVSSAKCQPFCWNSIMLNLRKISLWMNKGTDMCSMWGVSGVISGTWSRHQMETFSALLALCAGNSLVTGEFLAKRPVTRTFDDFLICAWINGWVDNPEAGDLRRHRAHYDVIVMCLLSWMKIVMCCSKFNWNLLPLAHLTICQHCFR